MKFFVVNLYAAKIEAVFDSESNATELRDRLIEQNPWEPILVTSDEARAAMEVGYFEPGNAP